MSSDGAILLFQWLWRPESLDTGSIKTMTVTEIIYDFLQSEFGAKRLHVLYIFHEKQERENTKLTSTIQ